MLPVGLTAQVQLRNLSLNSPDSMVLYIGINNTLAVSGMGNAKNITLKYHERVVLPDANGLFNIATFTKGETPILLFQGKRKIQAFTFAARYLSDPIVALGLCESESCTKDSILASRRLRVFLPSCLVRYRDEVLNFDFQIITAGKTGTLHHIKGSIIPDDLLPQLTDLKKGDQLLFSNIRSRAAFHNSHYSFSIVIR
jgi:GldM C-terminal domain